MEFEHNLMFDFISIFATILLTLVTCTIVFHKLKLRWPIKVNCWFCNNNTKIKREELEWWLCPSCKQFNGFSKNGDYTYKIPEQHKVSVNNSIRYCRSGATTEVSPKNTLCEECNKHQKLKLVELSNFEPQNERRYSKEIEKFQRTLEEKYPLCTNCNATVQNVLAKQAMWLARYKMLFFKQKHVHMLLYNAKRCEVIFRIVSTMIDSVIVYNTEILLLPIGGLFFQLCACWASTAKRRHSDILLAFLWICIIILLPFKEYKLLKTSLKNDWFTLEYVTQYHMVIFFAFIIGFMNVKPRSSIGLKKDIFLKKMETRVKRSTAQQFPEVEITENIQSFVKRNILDSNETTNSSVNMTNYLMSPVSVDVPNAVGTTIPTLRSTVDPELSTWSMPTNNLDLRSILSSKTNQFDNSGLDDSMSTLSILSLDDTLSNCQTRSSQMFEKKIYNAASSDLFKKSNNTFGRKCILSPPKLRSVTQTSWVAGGYWQEGMDAPSLSRSSSQSSGFGSIGSNCAPSREPSIHEFDQCSIVSDASLPYYGPKQNSVNSVRRFCQPPQSYSPFIRPKNPICHQTLKYSQGHHPFPQQTLGTQFTKSNTVFDDCCSQHSKGCTEEIRNSMNIQSYPPYATVATNPVWLHALLCGSLILNMIVVCTTLLR
ncbi:hypothetical protein KPH14_007228 [Odynerus spinipes]|uniref:Ima1 N-terminal domain-containing protein n=1 Tax=Odynerus spinipes TaxID=1348599 RepID=A0AAD9VII2_9HYME|nr:hypothetical protein KPH14_007228 [Odynerus spinipes]